MVLYLAIVVVYLGVGYCQILNTPIVLLTPFMATLLGVVFVLFLLVACSNPGIVNSTNMVEKRVMKRWTSRATSRLSRLEKRSKLN